MIKEEKTLAYSAFHLNFLRLVSKKLNGAKYNASFKYFSTRTNNKRKKKDCEKYEFPLPKNLKAFVYALREFVKKRS